VGFCNREVSEMAYIRMIIGVLVAIIVLSIMPAGVQAQSDDGLVAEWHFDEGSGSVLKDSSGNGNDGVIYGATWVEGKYGKALSFDGVDDYVDCGNGASLNFGTDTFAIETWVKTIDTTTDNWEGIVGRWGKSGDYYNGYWLQYFPNEGIWAFGWHGQIYLNPTRSISDGNWHHVVCQKTGSTSAELYIDGEFVGKRTDLPSISTDTTDPLSMGRLSSADIYGERYFSGIIDEVRIYNRALSAEEIKEHYEQGPTALSLIKTASPQSIKQGQTTTITLTVKNTGSTEIKDIEIADTIPQDLTFVDGETSKTYSSLTPKDSRQFQYVVQLSEAGTYNLNPATAIYANEEGNYHIVKSKPFAIEVIPSLVETTDQIQRTGVSNAQTASVHLHGEKTDVVMGEDILLKLAAVNLITKPTMHVQVIITPPSGMSVTSSEFVQSGAGLFTASYEIEPGVGRDIEVKMRSNQVGDFVVNGRIVYYFGDDMDNAEDHTLTLPITVRAEAEVTESSKESSTSGFAAVAAIIGLLLAYMRKRV